MCTSEKVKAIKISLMQIRNQKLFKHILSTKKVSTKHSFGELSIRHSFGEKGSVRGSEYILGGILG